MQVDTPGRGARGDVAGDIGGVEEDEQRFAGGVFAGPIEAAAGHGLVATNGKFESDSTFTEAPETGLLFGEDGADGVRAALEKRALAETLHDEIGGDGEKNGNREEEEELEWIGVTGMAEDGDEGEVEEPGKEERKDERELRDGVQGHLARRILESEVTIEAALLTGTEGVGHAGFGGKRGHRGEYRASARCFVVRSVGATVPRLRADTTRRRSGRDDSDLFLRRKGRRCDPASRTTLLRMSGFVILLFTDQFGVRRQPEKRRYARNWRRQWRRYPGPERCDILRVGGA